MTCVHWLKTSCAPKNSPSSMRHGFILCCTRHWALPHRLSLLPLLCCCRPPLRTQTCCPRIQLSTAKIHSRMVLLRYTTPPHNKHSQRPETWCCLHVWTWRSHKTVDWNSFTQAALRLFCIAPCRQKHWQMWWNSTVLFDERPLEVTEARRTETQCSHIWNQLGRPGVIIWWNPARWSRCVTTVNKLKALTSTSAFQESHNSRQTTRTRSRFHKFKYLYKLADENRFVSLQTKIKWWREYHAVQTPYVLPVWNVWTLQWHMWADTPAASGEVKEPWIVSKYSRRAHLFSSAVKPRA